MSANFIPARDVSAEKRRETVSAQLNSILSSYISGRGKETKIENATGELLRLLEPYLRLGTKNDKGATVMTETASMNKTKGPSSL